MAMSRKLLGAILLLVGSEAIGFLLGRSFYRLFLKTVPPLALSAFNEGAARVAFLLYGAIGGLAIFVFALAAALLSRWFLSPGPRPSV
jgi:hypothetical protein